MESREFDCKFRPAVFADRPELHELLHCCWIECYEPHVPPDVIVRFKADNLIDQHLDTFLTCTWVAIVDQEIVGSIAHSFGDIHGLFVKRALRRNWIGSSLLYNAMIDGARSLDVAAFNTDAIRFYRRCGWQKVGRFKEEMYQTNVPMLRMQVAASF